MKKYLLSAALLPITAVAALAGGLNAPTVEPAPVIVEAAPVLTFGNWQGGYAGANINWGKNPIDGLLNDPDGVSGALRGGYDWQMNRTVFGLGAEYDFGKLKGDDGASTEAKVGKAGTLFARLGYDAGDWLPYALAGYTWADAEVGATSANIDGYTLGLGVERKFTPNWSGYGELSYTDFGDVPEFGGANIDSQKIKFGVNYRF